MCVCVCVCVYVCVYFVCVSKAIPILSQQSTPMLNNHYLSPIADAGIKLETLYQW